MEEGFILWTSNGYTCRWKTRSRLQ